MQLKLSPQHKRVLRLLANGWTLKSHRFVDGTKVFRLHPLDGPAETIDPATIDCLSSLRLIDSNKKFPAATYWLTEEGKELVTTSVQLARFGCSGSRPGL